MPRKKTEKKRGPGRPRNTPKSADELRAKTLESMKRTAEAKGRIDYEAAEQGLDLMLNEKKLKQATATELKQLRRMAEELYDKLQIEKEYEADQAWEGGYGVYRGEASEGYMDAATWDEEHEFLKPKRKNAKKIKNIHTLTDKQKVDRGLALEPVPMEFNLESLEAELEERLMKEAKAQQEREALFPQGRRLTGRKKIEPGSDKRQKFWI